ncbi:hypothetical protein [Pedobacter panaciterrae]
MNSTRANKNENTRMSNSLTCRKNSELLVVMGIDPGTKTGLASYDCNTKQLLAVKTMKIHEAFEEVRNQHRTASAVGGKILVRVEDARKRKRYGANSNAKMQGAGAIKIQCKQWEEFLKTEDISYELVAPQRIRTKVDAKQFQMITGWTERTSNHGRDAGMLVFGL